MTYEGSLCNAFHSILKIIPFLPISWKVQIMVIIHLQQVSVVFVPDTIISIEASPADITVNHPDRMMTKVTTCLNDTQLMTPPLNAHPGVQLLMCTPPIPMPAIITAYVTPVDYYNCGFVTFHTYYVYNL